jgi:hypothetical protein
MSAQLKEWNAQISLLEAKIDNVAAEMRVKRAEELHSLRARQQAAADKFNELGRSTGQAWEEVRNTADKMWDDLKNGIAEAQAKFK